MSYRTSRSPVTGAELLSMLERTRRVDRYLDALLSDRRPPRHAPSPGDLDAIAAAIELCSVRPHAGMPDPRFIERLERRLRSVTQGELGRRRRIPTRPRDGMVDADVL
jgi:hypothetical protein